MSPATRRVWFYWLLLLLPTLAVGVGAIPLLRREQARIAAQSIQAADSKAAAVAARTRLIVENVELLAGDVQEGLLDTIEAQPPEALARFMEEWERDNPLVRTTFLARPDGMLLRPDSGAAAIEARGFYRRFGVAFRENPPWRDLHPPQPVGLQESPRPAGPFAERQSVASNVAQVQSARRDVQELLKARNYQSSASSSYAAAASMDRRETEGDTERGDGFSRWTPVPTSAAGSKGAVTQKSVEDAPVQQIGSLAAAAARRGWLGLEAEGRRHLLGWVQVENSGEVRGVELDLPALVQRLAAALPIDSVEGEGYALRDDQRRVIHQVGWVPRDGGTTVGVALASPLLRGWDVAAYLAPAPYGSTDGSAFFWVGTMLVGIFLAAILLGGSLLLQHARRSEEEAAQKTSFVANVSHEFKTPLTTIRLYAELLEQGRVRDAAQGGEYLRTIGRETQRLARMVNNALDFSRLEQGKKTFARQPLDLTDALARLLATQAPRLHEAGLRGDAQLPATALVVNTDRDAFEQIVLNLLDNACKYASAGGEVTINLTARGTVGAEVRVSDRGPGVPADHRDRVFEKFHRVDDTLTADKSGAGLGLSIARQLARGLGGDLRYVDRAGGGAEFILELP